MEIKNTRKGGNVRNRVARGHLDRGRSLERREEAQVRQESFSQLTLDEKLKEQLEFNKHEPFKKQYKKLLALKEQK